MADSRRAGRRLTTTEISHTLRPERKTVRRYATAAETADQGRVAVQSRTMVMSSARKASPGARPAAETVTLSLLVPGRRTS